MITKTLLVARKFGGSLKDLWMLCGAAIAFAALAYYLAATYLTSDLIRRALDGLQALFCLGLIVFVSAIAVLLVYVLVAGIGSAFGEVRGRAR